MDNRKPGRFERAKSETLERRCSVGSLKNKFRNNFINRLRTVRSRSVDRFRELCENYSDERCQTVMDLRKLLSSDVEAAALLNCEEVTDIIRQIEEELRITELQEQAENNLQYNDHEIECIVDNLMNKCTMCNNMTMQSVICENCLFLMNSNDFP